MIGLVPFASMMGIEVIESRWADAVSWGTYTTGLFGRPTIVTHNAKRLALNLANLGIDGSGRIALLPGKVAVEP